MKSTIRKARLIDVPPMVDLSEQKRIEYQRYQPTFWRKAEDSREKQIPFFASLMGSDRAIALVHERGGKIDGFIIALLQPAPPVYDPGGLTCIIDDFIVAEAKDWQTVGKRLLSEVIREAKRRGAVQVVVVCGRYDAPKRIMLASVGCSIASEWWVREI